MGDSKWTNVTIIWIWFRRIFLCNSGWIILRNSVSAMLFFNFKYNFKRTYTQLYRLPMSEGKCVVNSITSQLTALEALYYMGIITILLYSTCIRMCTVCIYWHDGRHTRVLCVYTPILLYIHSNDLLTTPKTIVQTFCECADIVNVQAAQTQTIIICVYGTYENTIRCEKNVACHALFPYVFRRWSQCAHHTPYGMDGIISKTDLETTDCSTSPYFCLPFFFSYSRFLLTISFFSFLSSILLSMSSLVKLFCSGYVVDFFSLSKSQVEFNICIASAEAILYRNQNFQTCEKKNAPLFLFCSNAHRRAAIFCC